MDFLLAFEDGGTWFDLPDCRNLANLFTSRIYRCLRCCWFWESSARASPLDGESATTHSDDPFDIRNHSFLIHEADLLGGALIDEKWV